MPDSLRAVRLLMDLNPVECDLGELRRLTDGAAPYFLTRDEAAPPGFELLVLHLYVQACVVQAQREGDHGPLSAAAEALAAFAQRGDVGIQFPPSVEAEMLRALAADWYGAERSNDAALVAAVRGVAFAGVDPIATPLAHHLLVSLLAALVRRDKEAIPEFDGAVEVLLEALSRSAALGDAKEGPHTVRVARAAVEAMPVDSTRGGLEAIEKLCERHLALSEHRPRPIRDHRRALLGPVRGADCTEVKGGCSHGSHPCRPP